MAAEGRLVREADGTYSRITADRPAQAHSQRPAFSLVPVPPPQVPVRHLCATCDLCEDKLYGHVKPVRPGRGSRSPVNRAPALHGVGAKQGQGLMQGAGEVLTGSGCLVDHCAALECGEHGGREFGDGRVFAQQAACLHGGELVA